MTRNPAFSLCYPYHNNPRMLAQHYDSYVGYPPEIARGLELVVCDDASEDAERATYPEEFLRWLGERGEYPHVSIFRIPPPHIPWSHRVASNIAAHESRGKWLLMTDIDHIVPLGTWRFLMDDDRRPRLATDRAYRFERRNVDGSTYKSHPDSWLFHRSLWDQIKGYDERYRGSYGQNMAFINRVEHYCPIECLPVPLIRVGRDEIPDASERTLPRKSPEARETIRLLRRKHTLGGTFYADTRLSAVYERVEP